MIIYSKANSKEVKANKAFGTDECSVIMHMATMDYREHTCKVCNETFGASSMNENICKNCAKELSRCDFCGEKLKVK